MLATCGRCDQWDFFFFFCLRVSDDDAEDVVLAHDEILRAIEFDLLAGVLAEQHRVAWL